MDDPESYSTGITCVLLLLFCGYEFEGSSITEGLTRCCMHEMAFVSPWTCRAERCITVPSTEQSPWMSSAETLGRTTAGECPYSVSVGSDRSIGL